MKAEIKNNRAYCPICHERNYKVLADKHRTVSTSKGTAIEFTARCKCGQEFTYLAIIKIDSEMVFTEQEETKRMNEREKEIACTIDLIQKICIELEIALIAEERKGQHMVLVQDARSGKKYAIIKNKEGDKQCRLEIR